MRLVTKLVRDTVGVLNPGQSVLKPVLLTIMGHIFCGEFGRQVPSGDKPGAKGPREVSMFLLFLKECLDLYF